MGVKSSAGGIQVTTEDMRSSSAEIRTKAGEYRDLFRVDLIQREIEGTMTEHWTGVDYEEFRREMIEEWKPQFEKMYEEMIKYAAFLITSAEIYEGAQEQAEITARNIIK